MKCKHRGYQAKRRPRVNCEACWRQYIEKHPVEKPVPYIDENNLLLPQGKEGFSWWNNWLSDW